MPKLLSQSMHEEFESNSAFQIRDQKERREENTRKLKHLRNWFLQHCSQLQPCLPSCALFILLPVHPFYVVPCLHLFLVFSHFIPCNSFWFWFFFGNFIYIEHLYKPQFVQTLNHSLRQYKERAAVSPLLPFLPFSFIFFPLSRLSNTPLRMKNQRMVG